MARVLYEAALVNSGNNKKKQLLQVIQFLIQKNLQVVSINYLIQLLELIEMHQLRNSKLKLNKKLKQKHKIKKWMLMEQIGKKLILIMFNGKL